MLNIADVLLNTNVVVKKSHIDVHQVAFCLDLHLYLKRQMEVHGSVVFFFLLELDKVTFKGFKLTFKHLHLN